jgi:hypothetical protein
MSNHISGGNGELLVGVDLPSNEVSCDPKMAIDSMVDAPNGEEEIIDVEMGSKWDNGSSLRA